MGGPEEVKKIVLLVEDDLGISELIKNRIWRILINPKSLSKIGFEKLVEYLYLLKDSGIEVLDGYANNLDFDRLQLQWNTTESIYSGTSILIQLKNKEEENEIR